MYSDLSNLCAEPESPVQQAMAVMESNRLGIVLVVDHDNRLIGTVTDGDLRRAVLANISLDEPIRVLLEQKAVSPYAKPVTAPIGTDRATLLQILQHHNIRHLPIVDPDQHVVAMVSLDEFVVDDRLPLEAVIMAGGLGSRLRPLTNELPKPMLPVGDRPLMEIIIEQLRAANIEHISISLNHESEKITQHFGDGRDFGIAIDYVTEEQPLGTAGALRLMEVPKQTVLVINGDILTEVDFRAMRIYHQEHGAELTVAVQQYHFQVPYGVIECEGALVQRLSEKPTLKFFVNAGIYLLEPSVFGSIPSGQKSDMTDLIQRLLNEGRNVVAFPIREYWMDIGEHADYQQAQEHVKNWHAAS